MSLVRRLALAAIACAALVGCSEEATEVVKAVPIGAHDRCKMCGMVIVHYPGPKAEIFIKGADGEAVKFCSGRDAFTFALLIVVLCVKPTGLFGEKVTDKV